MWDRNPSGAPTVFPGRACMGFAVSTLHGRELAGQPHYRFLLPRIQVGARVDIEIVVAAEISEMPVDRESVLAACYPRL